MHTHTEMWGGGGGGQRVAATSTGAVPGEMGIGRELGNGNT